MVPGAKWGLEMRGNEHKSKAPGRGVRPAGARSAMNEVVCGAMMLAYERAGKWDEVMLCNVSSVAFVCKGVEYLLLDTLICLCSIISSYTG